MCGTSTTLSSASSACGTCGSSLEDVEPRAGDAAFGQRGDQRRLVDQRAARDVDEEAFRPERIEHGRVDQVARRCAAGRGHDEIVGPARQLDSDGLDAKATSVTGRRLV